MAAAHVASRLAGLEARVLLIENQLKQRDQSLANDAKKDFESRLSDIELRVEQIEKQIQQTTSSPTMLIPSSTTSNAGTAPKNVVYRRVSTKAAPILGTAPHPRHRIVLHGDYNSTTDDLNVSLPSTSNVSSNLNQTDWSELDVSNTSTNSDTDPQSGECSRSIGNDGNDDICSVCRRGGVIVCCDKCPRSFHFECHVPTLTQQDTSADPWFCGLCTDIESPIAAGSDVFLSKQQKVCERVLLDLFCHKRSLPFHKPVERSVPNYYQTIANPMDFSSIKQRLCKLMKYRTIKDFHKDIRLVFANCQQYNPVGSKLNRTGSKLLEYFENKISGLLDCSKKKRKRLSSSSEEHSN